VHRSEVNTWPNGKRSLTLPIRLKNSYQVLGGTQKYYLISREGFSLVVMGFTGKKAMQWKVNFIEGEEWTRSLNIASDHKIEYCLTLDMVKDFITMRMKVMKTTTEKNLMFSL